MKLVMTLVAMENGTHRATFSVVDAPERVVVGTSRSQTFDLAFAEIRKLFTKPEFCSCGLHWGHTGKHQPN